MRVPQHALIRLTLDEMLDTAMSHWASDVDAEPQSKRLTDGVLTLITGHTTWVSSTVPTLTIGWQWSLQGATWGAMWSRIGLPTSNVMLIRSSGRDFGRVRSRYLMATVVDALPWREKISEFVAVSPTLRSNFPETYQAW